MALDGLAWFELVLLPLLVFAWGGWELYSMRKSKGGDGAGAPPADDDD